MQKEVSCNSQKRPSLLTNFYQKVFTYEVTGETARYLGAEDLHDPKYDHYSIVGIAEEAGFNSKSAFNTLFKKATGLTPSQFRKENTSN